MVQLSEEKKNSPLGTSPPLSQKKILPKIYSSNSIRVGIALPSIRY